MLCISQTHALCVAISVLAFSLRSSAQIMTGSIAGTVSDSSGLIPGVSVKFTSESVRQTLTEPGGASSMPCKRAATSSPSSTISLAAIHLQLGDVSESLVVRAEGSAVQLSTGERSGIIGGQAPHGFLEERSGVEALVREEVTQWVSHWFDQ